MASALVLATLSNPNTGEFLKYEVCFKFTEAKSLAVIKFETACRQVSKWPIMVANPLRKAVTFSCTTTVPDIHFQPHGDTFEVSAAGEVSGEVYNMDVCFRRSGAEGVSFALIKNPILS